MPFGMSETEVDRHRDLGMKIVNKRTENYLKSCEKGLYLLTNAESSRLLKRLNFYSKNIKVEDSAKMYSLK